VVAAEHRLLSTEEAARGDLQKEQPAIVSMLEDLVEEDPCSSVEAGVRGVVRGVVGGGVPAGADGAEAHVVVEVVGGEEGVGDETDEVRWERV
jgi:hypothetical protein